MPTPKPKPLPTAPAGFDWTLIRSFLAALEHGSLLAGARAIFPDLGPPDREWMGLRPSMPDSRPVIGPSPRGPEVIHAYGHGHIGLTLAPITARLVASLIAGRPSELDLTPYAPGRF